MRLARELRALLAVCSFCVPIATAQSVWPWQIDQKLVAGDAAADDRFGTAMAARGEFALVGAPLDDDAGIDAGAVYAYRRVGGSWTFEGKLLSPTPQPGGHFGFALALEGNVLAIGAPRSDELSWGRTHVFRRDVHAWVWEAELDQHPKFERFGASIDISRDTIAVGSPRVFLTPYGRVDVFRKVGGVWSRIWFENEPPGRYGTSVAIHDGTLLVGVPDVELPQEVRVYRESTPSQWIQTATLHSTTNVYGWGVSVAIADGYAAVGATSGPGVTKSLVDIFTFDTSTSSGFDLVAEFVEFGPPFKNSGFGRSMRFDESPTSPPMRLVVGEPRDDFTTKHDGMAHVFARFGTEWTRVARITAPDPGFHDEFGRSVAFAGNQVLVGAWQADSPSSDAGAVYAFDITPLPTTYCTPKPNSLGCAAVMSATGLASASSGSGFVIECTDVLPGKTGVLLYGFDSQAEPFVGGHLCVVPPFSRAGKRVASDGWFCDGVYGFDFNAFVASGADPALVAGAKIACQWVVRDPADPTGTGLSGGLWFVLGP
ncbi:MAG: FG-GAP repeat protein [Planctomycetes bacterium]|nr:FG-GAP repeat protein [Planctomycetota bacterium]